ncbi:hypothetical protein CAPTEDRAFT_211208 [Capitella teleta]|uniref:Death domain-containing protein n=1 Tax=Capitella teleta TaxID=283909 RepID=R7T9L3_CAPTE|nr:hypothetical protein CAPTEDRAFT_211208 [Capitella teleta]|eukprot:ELT87659.1 hypothetical protein CAPTEDRAFT_211208 [Capitella teleta]
MANNSINALTLVVSWILSTVTTLIILAIIYSVRRCRRAAKKKRRLSGQPLTRIESMKSERSGVTSISNNNDFGSSIHKPQGQTSRQISMESDVSRMDPAHSRRRRDDVLKWCNMHNLPEKVADCLRDAGFVTYEMLDTLRVEDIGNLNLPSTGLQCLLRKTLEQIQQKQIQKERINSSSSNTSSQPNLRYPNRLDSSSSVMNVPPAGVRKGGGRKRSMEGMQVIMDNSPSHSTTQKSRRNSKPVRRTSDPHGFKGMLSDQGLHEISTELGREWLHLASLLKVKSSKQEQIRMDHPNNTQLQIFEMLKHWRNTSNGRKEQLKGLLHHSLNMLDGKCLDYSHSPIPVHKIRAKWYQCAVAHKEWSSIRDKNQLKSSQNL